MPIGILVYAALWLAGGLVWTPRIQERVQEDARRALSHHKDMREVEAQASGRMVLLTGTVPHAADMARAEVIVRNGTALASAVRSDVTVKPPPPGWLLLGFAGETLHLTGVVSSQQEAQEVLEETRRQHEKPGLRIHTSVRVDADRFGEPDSLRHTSGSIPTSRSGLKKDEGALALAISGDGWKIFPPGSEGAVQRAITAREPDTSVLAALVMPVFKAVRDYDARQRVAKAERERLSLLPAPYLILMKDADVWLLRGEVGSAEAKSGLLTAILDQHGEKRVLDEILVTDRRNPFSDLNALTASLDDLSQTPGEITAYVGLPGHGWLGCDLSQPEPASILQKKIADADVALVSKDMLAARREIGAAREAAAPELPAFLTLILLPHRVLISGELPDEASRAQTLAAVRGAYPGQTLTHDLRLNVRCTDTAGLPHTLKALPPSRSIPPDGLIAFAIPGEGWLQRSVSEKLTGPDGLAASGLVPDDTLMQRALESLLPGLPVLRAHLETSPRTRKKS